MKRFSIASTFFLLLVVFFTINNLSVNATDDNEFEEKRILFISSYSSSFPTFFQQIDGLRDTFEGYPVILDVEFMDSKRYFNDENLENFKETITYKLSQENYDLIMTSDDNAINFVMENHDDLFNDLPVIFFGVNNDVNAFLYSQNDNVTGVVEDISIKDTIELAIMLNPNANNVIALTDNTVSGQSDLVRFLDKEESFEDITFSKIDMSELSMDEFLLELHNVDDSSVIILLSALRDVDNIPYEFEDSVELILENTDQPIYHLFEHGIEEGLIGGIVVSHYKQAQTAGEIAIEYFNGVPFEDFELVDNSPNVVLINHEVFENYGYKESKLPDSTIFVNQEITLLQEYLWYFIIGITFVIVQTAIIFGLIVNVRLNKKAKKEIETSNEKLENAYKELEVANDELLHKSWHDDLTGLYNRNYFEIQYPVLNEIRHEMPVSIILIDVNGLKLINDAFGHINGDKVLIETSNLLLKLFKDSDIFRIGGDEFAIIPYGKKEKTVDILISKLNKEISKIKVEGIALSVSVGYAFLTKNKTLREMFTEAEDWMYREKLNHVPSNRSSIIEAIKATINQKDKYSEEHSKRVSDISVKISQLMKLSENITSEIKTSGLLHDIGKIIVPTHILNKEGKLDPEEYEEIKKHSEIGYRILNSVSSMRDISEYVFCHHERPDGKGYPRGLKGDEIPIQSRIIAIADAIDAMLTDRNYRAKLTKEQCYKELEDNMGTQFCYNTTVVVLKHFDEIFDLVEELS